MDMASPVREQIFRAIRAFTSSTIVEAEDATRAILRIVANSLPRRSVNVPVAAISIIRDLIDGEIKNTERFKAINGNSTDGHLALMRDALAAFSTQQETDR